jgi:CheY-like chemotaxis protein
MKVVIIDDDAIFTMMHSVMVKRCNLDNDPLTFLSAKEALEFLQAQSDSTNQYLILLDINMPEMDGWEFLMMLNNTVVAQKRKSGRSFIEYIS